MSKHCDTLIVGAGVIGLTTAYHLAQAGQSVTVLERHQPGREASWAGAGIVPPGNPRNARNPIDRLRAISSEAFLSFSGELFELTGIDNGYRQCGGIEFFESLAERDFYLQLWRQEGLEAEPLSDLSCEPHLQAVQPHAVRLEGMAQVRNPWHLHALLQACLMRGVTVIPDTAVERWQIAEHRWHGVISRSGEHFRADRLLAATGAWAQQSLQPFQVQVPIAPVRGQIALFRGQQPLLRRVITHGKMYLVPRDDGRLLAGATEEPEVGFEKGITQEGQEHLIEFAYHLCPALRQCEIEAGWSGLRPGSADGLPFLGAIPGCDNAFFAGGHYRAGIQLSIGTAQCLSALMQGKTPPVPLEAFRLDRPSAPPSQSAFRS